MDNQTVISLNQISKRYRLGEIHRSTNSFRDRLFDFFRKSSHTEDILWALKDITFELKKGEILGIIGRNGAGKSTLLKILSKITKPSSGTARIKGRLGSLLEVGTGFHPELTGRENIFLNGAVLGMKKAEIKSKFDEIVAFAEVEPFLDTPVKRYSSGMYVRLAFAVAAHLDPEILLIDEVLAVGDDRFQRRCMGKMGHVAREGRTILFVSHNMGAIRRLVDKCILIQDGSIKESGDPDSVVTRYLRENIRESGQMEFRPDLLKTAQITRLRIVTDQGEPTSVVDPSDEIRVEVDFVVRSVTRKSVDLVVALSSFDENMIYYFASKDARISPENWDPGTYHAQLIFPGKVLNCGRYVIKAAVNIDGKAHHNHPRFGEGLCLELTQSSRIGASGYQMKRKNALLIIEPQFCWQRASDQPASLSAHATERG